jgi:hypothetical protein
MPFCDPSLSVSLFSPTKQMMMCMPDGKMMACEAVMTCPEVRNKRRKRNARRKNYASKKDVKIGPT